jgi:4-hydroxy-tetrahydrodipicolinate synthase
MSKNKPLVLRGLYPATITPFNRDSTVDYVSLRRHLAETAQTPGVKGLVVNAGLGEILQLTDDEKVRIVALAREVLKPDQILVCGCEGRGPVAAVRDGLLAKKAGADALLVLPPFDVRPYRRLARDPAAVHAFFERMDREVDLPMVVFQYPDHSGVSYSLEALVRIADLKNVVAIKAATPVMNRYVEIWDTLHEKLSILPAVDSPPLLGMLLHGAHGALIGISVIGTAKWAELVEAAMSGDAAKAARIHREFCIPIMDGAFENQEPTSSTSEVASVKEALRQLGVIATSLVREPAVNVTDAHCKHIHHSLVAAGLLAK